MAVIRTNVAGHIGLMPFATPSGYGPTDLRSAYALPSTTAGSGQTVAIVDAFNDPHAAADLAVYRSQYGLPACTAASGCFKQVSQTGTSTLPKTNAGWATEESLDMDMVSSVCPLCHIILVEATTASNTNLGLAVDEAAKLGANAISNSYGGSDVSDATWGKYYDHPGIAVTASAGDSGYGVSYPASSTYVTGVGGTTLRTASNSRGWTETAWNGTGSGCGAHNAKTSGQGTVTTSCTHKAVADVSAVANPSTGVAVYDSTAYSGSVGWQVYGGTSVASPIIASVYALAGVSANDNPSQPYAHASSLFDVTSGSNGTCTTKVWCTAGTGWDGPTGLGTPDGDAAF
jgi:subtilase family serine protease